MMQAVPEGRRDATQLVMQDKKAASAGAKRDVHDASASKAGLSTLSLTLCLCLCFCLCLSLSLFGGKIFIKILSVAFLCEVADGQTDGRTDRHTDNKQTPGKIYRPWLPRLELQSDNQGRRSWELEGCWPLKICRRGQSVF